MGRNLATVQYFFWCHLAQWRSPTVYLVSPGPCKSLNFNIQLEGINGNINESVWKIEFPVSTWVQVQVVYQSSVFVWSFNNLTALITFLEIEIYTLIFGWSIEIWFLVVFSCRHQLLPHSAELVRLRAAVQLDHIVLVREVWVCTGDDFCHSA